MQHFRLRYEFIYIVMRATGCDGSRALAPIHLPMKFMVGGGDSNCRLWPSDKLIFMDGNSKLIMLLMIVIVDLLSA